MPMDTSRDNPAGNKIGPGITDDQLRQAVEKSGYPLQSVVGDVLRASFSVQDEWCYVDRDSKELRAIDIRAEMRLHEWTPQPRVRPQLTVLVECKQSQLPFVFFLSEPATAHLEHPKVFGLKQSSVVVSSDDDPSTWTCGIIHALDLQAEAFQTVPDCCTSFSKAVRKGSEIELSGTEAYSGLMLPIIKALEHLDQSEAPPSTAWYFDAHLSVGLGVLDAPMVGVRVENSQTTMTLVPWVRALRHEYSLEAERWDRNRVWIVDIVHREFLATYLNTHLVPFAKTFAERVLRHTEEIATGEGFASGMGKDSWENLEARLKPRGLKSTVKRTNAIGRNLARLVRRKGKRNN